MANANYTAAIQEKTPSVKQVEKAVTLAMQNSGGGGGGGLEDAPSDGQTYVRVNGDWVIVRKATLANYQNAYLYAVEGGFTGTEEDFISMMLSWVTDAPSDDQTHVRVNGAWHVISNATLENYKSAYLYAVEGGFTGTEEEFSALMLNWLTDAPNDNNVYVRVNGAWAVVTNATVTSA